MLPLFTIVWLAASLDAYLLTVRSLARPRALEPLDAWYAPTPTPYSAPGLRAIAAETGYPAPAFWDLPPAYPAPARPIAAAHRDFSANEVIDSLTRDPGGCPSGLEKRLDVDLWPGDWQRFRLEEVRPVSRPVWVAAYLTGGREGLAEVDAGLETEESGAWINLYMIWPTTSQKLHLRLCLE